MAKAPDPRGIVAMCALLVGSGVVSARQARANGRIPAGHQIVFSPSDPNTVVMEATFGLLFSHDQGATFQWVCESAVGYGRAGNEDPSVGLTTKFVLAGTHEGLFVASDLGCSWTSPVPDPVTDVVVRPDDPHTALVLTSKFTGSVSDAGQNLYTTRVLVTHDDGATWMPQGVAIDPTVTVETIEVARSDPNRIYVAGATGQPNSEGGLDRVGVVLASTNGGASYTAGTIALAPPFETVLGAAFVSAVDPANPQRVYVRIADGSVDRLVVSDDGAATFRTAFQGRGPLLGFALSGDGSKVYVGGSTDGVQFASAYGGDAGGALAFTQRSKADVSCLTWQAGTLNACMTEPGSRFLQQFGVSGDDGASFSPRFFFGCVAGASACGDGSPAAQCEANLPLLSGSIGTCPGVTGDAGPGEGDSSILSDASSLADAGLGIEPLPRSTSSGSCGCQSGETAAVGGLSASILLAMMGLRRRGTRYGCGARRERPRSPRT